MIDDVLYQYWLERRLIDRYMYKKWGLYYVNPTFKRNFKKVKLKELQKLYE